MDLPDSLQAKLDEYNRKFEALSSVLGNSNELLDSGVTQELRTERTKEILSEALPVAVSTMIELAAYAESESVRYKAAQFLIATSLGKDPGLQANDPLKSLIERLTPVAIEDEWSEDEG